MVLAFIVKLSFLKANHTKEKSLISCIVYPALFILQIALNGKPFAEYKHRAPVAMVTHLVIDGDVTLRQSRKDPPNDDTISQSGFDMDTVIRSFTQLFNIPPRDYNLVSLKSPLPM